MSDNKPVKAPEPMEAEMPDRLYAFIGKGSGKHKGWYVHTRPMEEDDIPYFSASIVEAKLATIRRDTAEHAAEIAGRYDDWRGDGNVVDEVARVILSEILGEQQDTDILAPTVEAQLAEERQRVWDAADDKHQAIVTRLRAAHATQLEQVRRDGMDEAIRIAGDFKRLDPDDVWRRYGTTMLGVALEAARDTPVSGKELE